jgi:hypothetical protein
MRIISFGPASGDRPYIPTVAILEDGSKTSELDCPMENFASPIDVPDGYWFAILENNSVEVFPSETSKEWAAKKASEIILRASTSNGDPLGRLASIRSAASLIGIPISDLLIAISRFGGESNSLYESFIKMREKS